MKKTVVFGLIGFAALALAACQTADPALQEAAAGKTAEQAFKETGAKPLTAAELKDFYSKPRTYSWVTPENRTGKTETKPDGTSMLTSGKFATPGTWRLKGDMMCSSFEKLKERGELCGRVYPAGGNTYKVFRPDGSQSATITVEN